MQKKKKTKKLEREKKKINDDLIKEKIIRDIRTLFEQEDDDYYLNLKRVSSFWNNIYNKYESTCDKNKNLSPDEILTKLILLEGYNDWSSRIWCMLN